MAMILPNYKRLNVVITGGSKGFGKALAREFLYSGHNVFITSRNTRDIWNTVKELKEQTKYSSKYGLIAGSRSDVSNYVSIKDFAIQANKYFDNEIDIWINNSGYSAGYNNLMNTKWDKIEEIINTNLLGTIYSTKLAMKQMLNQKRMGHIFCVEGAGSDGIPTPNYSIYGSTKIAITHFVKSLYHELQNRDIYTDKEVGIHTISPGMIITDLLIEGTYNYHKRFFNIFAELPETVADDIASKIISVVNNSNKNKNLTYLTIPMIVYKLFNSYKTRGRFFDEKGNAVYLEEKERINLLDKFILPLEEELCD